MVEYSHIHVIIHVCNYNIPVETFFSQLDTVLHELLKMMSDAQPGQESSQKMKNASLQCLKVAEFFPAVMIRYCNCTSAIDALIIIVCYADNCLQLAGF